MTRRRLHRLLLLGLLAGCQQNDQVTLTFGADGVGLSGFVCEDTQKHLLLDRAVADGGVRPISVIFDVIPLQGLPDCRLQDLLGWCSAQTCAPNPALRTCLTLDPAPLDAYVAAPDGGASLRTALLQAFQGLNQPILASGVLAKQGVLFRAVGTVDACDAGDGGLDFDPNHLLGCAYSCPVEIGSGDGAQTVSLGFDTLTPQCDASQVIACANSKFP